MPKERWCFKKHSDNTRQSRRRIEGQRCWLSQAAAPAALGARLHCRSTSNTHCTPALQTASGVATAVAAMCQRPKPARCCTWPRRPVLLALPHSLLEALHPGAALATGGGVPVRELRPLLLVWRPLLLRRLIVRHLLLGALHPTGARPVFLVRLIVR